MADERRSARRAHIGGVRVTYESATGERVETVAQDLARGGLFVRTAKPLAVGKRIALEIQVIGEQGTWSALGRVVWTREAADGERPAGMGVKLIDIEDSVAAAIDRLVETRERTEPGVGAPSAPPAIAPRAPAMSIPIDLVPGRRAPTTTAVEATATTETAAGADKRSGCGWSLVALGALAAGGAVAAYALVLRAPPHVRAGPVPPPPSVATTPPTTPPTAAPNEGGAATSALVGSSVPTTSTPAGEPSSKKPGLPPPSATGAGRSTPSAPRRTENPY
jgi:uncharacterized protein (TIGR02266 family)